MNFPGLDPVWSGLHHALHATRLLRTWSLEECRAGINRGERVLVVSSIALGDSLLATPLLATLAHQLGPERVSFLVKKPFAELYQGDPHLHRVFTVRGKYRWENLRESLRAEPHRIALLSNFTEPDLVPWLAHCGVRGFLRYRTRWTKYPRWMANREMLREPRAADYATGHAIENNLALAEALDIRPITHQITLPHLTSPAQREPLLLIHPGASRPTKVWPVENWAQVASDLLQAFPVKLALTGTRGEIPLAEAIRSRLSASEQTRTEILAGRLSLRELAQTQARATAFLSGDTGPYHLALAVKCPTLTLFAPTDRGSSIEACGPHQADPARHFALSTHAFGESISTLTPGMVLPPAQDLMRRCLTSP